MEYINSKTLSRLAVVQGLYQYNINAIDKDSIVSNIVNYYRTIQQVKQDFNISESISIKIDIQYFITLFNLTLYYLSNIDKIIQVNLKNHEFNRLSILVVAILRAGISELLYYKNTPHKVVVDEFTNLANMLLPIHEINFINSFLDNIQISYEKKT